MIDLGTLGGVSSTAVGINNLGQVVGTITSPSANTAFLYSEGSMVSLGTLDGTDGSSSRASDINDAGQIVGTASVGFSGHAFLYQNGTMSDLGTLGGSESEAYGINNFGQVVGFSLAPGSVERAFLYQGGTMSDLGTLGGSDSEAESINDFGQIVGFSNPLNSPAGHAFLYDQGAMLDLNDLIDPAAGWLLVEATEINNSGQIIASGKTPTGSIRTVLLTPVPEVAPSTFLFPFLFFAIAINRLRYSSMTSLRRSETKGELSEGSRLS